MLDGTVLSTGVVICRTQAVIRWWWIVLVYPAHKIYIRLVKFVFSKVVAHCRDETIATA